MVHGGRECVDFFKVHRGGQRAFNTVNVALLLQRCHANLVAQQALHLHEHTRLGFIAVGHHADDDPPDQTHAPGHAKRDPPAAPDAVQYQLNFLIEITHDARIRRQILG